MSLSGIFHKLMLCSQTTLVNSSYNSVSFIVALARYTKYNLQLFPKYDSLIFISDNNQIAQCKQVLEFNSQMGIYNVCHQQMEHKQSWCICGWVVDTEDYTRVDSNSAGKCING